MRESPFYTLINHDRIQCTLCPRYCKLKAGQHGFCYVRKNLNGKIVSLAYGKPYALNVDPIEKKPLYHFLPGSRILSIGTAGCNMACKYCQNWDLSKAKIDHQRAVDLPPERLLQTVLHYESPSIAYTYNEPTVFAEYAMETAKLGQKYQIKNVMVTNGYIAPEAIEEVYKNIDAANVDLKAFTDKFYKNLTLSDIDPVLYTLKKLKEMGIWIEITNLIIPSYNDDLKDLTKMIEWILAELDEFVPVHFTAFHPDYQIRDISPTTPSTLSKIRNLALDIGLKYVYVGNVVDETGSSTYCHNCNSVLVKRSVYHTQIVNLKNKSCKKCGQDIPGIFH